VFMMCVTGNGLLSVSVDLFMTQFVGVKLFLHNSSSWSLFLCDSVRPTQIFDLKQF
jgi:hypothetical protein